MSLLVLITALIRKIFSWRRRPAYAVVRSSQPRLETLEAREVPASANELFVDQLYQDVLRRAADPGGLQAHTSFLDQGGTRDQLANVFLNSTEFLVNKVSYFYSNYLHRGADYNGLQMFVGFLRSGGTTEQMRLIMLGSQEYYTTQGHEDPQEFLRALYRDVLHRDIDLGGMLSHLNSMRQGISRDVIAATIAQSLEARASTINEYYQLFLHRDGDVGGIASFLSVVNERDGEMRVISTMLSSQEFFDNSKF